MIYLAVFIACCVMGGAVIGRCIYLWIVNSRLDKSIERDYLDRKSSWKKELSWIDRVWEKHHD